MKRAFALILMMIVLMLLFPMPALAGSGSDGAFLIWILLLFVLSFIAGMVVMFLIARRNQKLAAQAFNMSLSSFKAKVKDFAN